MGVREALQQFADSEKAPEYRTMVDVVRCVECKHGETDYMQDMSHGYCCKLNDSRYVDRPDGQRARVWPVHPPDWYCADGELK